MREQIFRRHVVTPGALELERFRRQSKTVVRCDDIHYIIVRTINEAH